MTPTDSHDGVVEVADFTITEGSAEQFIDAYHQAREIILQSEGIGQMRMTRSVESPNRFILFIEWPSVAAHEAFRNAPAFDEWRGLIGPFFAAPPVVEHVETAG